MIFVLLILFQIKHFVADYPLQNKYMLGKFKSGTDFILPLLAHCGVHFGFTFAISLLFVSVPKALTLATFDLVAHFIMDRIKASPKMLGRFESISKGEYQGLITSKLMCEDAIRLSTNPNLIEESKRRMNEIDTRFKSNVFFWWALGLDQAIHHLTHYVIIYFIMRG